MIVRMSRFFLLLLIILVASFLLPYFYWMSFSERIVTVSVRYSPVSDAFITSTYIDKKFSWIGEGQESYTMAQVDSLLPFLNYRVLAAKEKMPDSIKGQKIKLEDVRLNNLFLRIRPRSLDQPQIQLYPLFESKPARFKLEMPREYFRITERMEFIDATTNKIDEEQTKLFTDRLTKAGFEFPAKQYFTNPTTRKAFDDGYFVVDNSGQLFHIKKINSKPFCLNTNIPNDFRIKHMLVKEMNLKEFHSIVYSEAGEVFLLTYDDYRLQKLPIEGFDTTKDELLIIGNIFNRVISLISDSENRTFVTDRNYNLIDQKSVSWENQEARTAGMVSRYLFPFELTLQERNSSLVKFYFSGYFLPSLIFGIILMIALFIMQRLNIRVGNKWYDYLIVLSTGIFGFIAVVILENTDD